MSCRVGDLSLSISCCVGEYFLSVIFCLRVYIRSIACRRVIVKGMNNLLKITLSKNYTKINALERSVASYTINHILSGNALVICNHACSPGGGWGIAMEMCSVLLLHCPHSEGGNTSDLC